LKAKRIEIY